VGAAQGSHTDIGIGANRRVPPASPTLCRSPNPSLGQATARWRQALPQWHYFFVPKSTLGVCISVGAMSKVAIGCEEGYMTERQMRPGKVTSSVL
jgi:hypothetical protein